MADDASPLFHVGATYRITTGIGENEGYSSFTVLDYQPPLLKVEAVGIETIFNTTSPSFVMAEKQLSEDEQLARLEDFPEYLKPGQGPSL